jgi:hypothetical protein
VWTSPPRRRIKLHPRPHAAEVLFFFRFSMRGNAMMAAGLSSFSLDVSLLVCRVNQTAVSTALSMQCHVRIPEPSHPPAVRKCFGMPRKNCSFLGGLVCFVDGVCEPPTCLATSLASRGSAGIRHIRGLLSRDGCTASLKCCARRLCVPQG